MQLMYIMCKIGAVLNKLDFHFKGIFLSLYFKLAGHIYDASTINNYIMNACMNTQQINKL